MTLTSRSIRRNLLSNPAGPSKSGPGVSIQTVARAHVAETLPTNPLQSKHVRAGKNGANRNDVAWPRE